MAKPTQRDEDLLALLRVNARESVAALARKLGLSRSTVQDRLRRLEESGVILGYDVRLAEDKRPGVSALVLLEAEQRTIARTIKALCEIPEVETVYTVSGRFDLAVVAAAHTTGDLDMVLDHIVGVEGVKRAESSVILATKLDRR
ncbi:MAG: AsnC family transcriptional regulator [Hyphomicrobiales bacterium]|nr:MAG: AsnC family transcriptional regulator [Hyphomicrobiales bacterium]